MERIAIYGCERRLVAGIRQKKRRVENLPDQ